MFETDQKTDTETRVEKRKIWTMCKYVWTIRNFDSHIGKGVGHVITSPSFSANSDDPCYERWCLAFYPFGINVACKGISLYLRLESASKFPVFVKFEFSFRNSLDEIFEEKKREHLYTGNAGYGFDSFSDERFWLSDSFDNIVKIRVDIYYNVGKLERFQKIDPDVRLTDSLRSVLKDSKFSDVMLIAGNEEFKVHKVILSIRSPVFMAMFSHDVLENVSGEVKIEDFSADTIRSLLRFIYTDELEIHDVDEAMSMARAAEKYDISDLKRLCDDYLQRYLSVSNVEEVLLFADTYNIFELKQYAIEYIFNHPKNFTCSSQFKKMETENPHLVTELLVQMVKKWQCVNDD